MKRIKLLVFWLTTFDKGFNHHSLNHLYDFQQSDFR
jgi:hypothetical protein